MAWQPPPPMPAPGPPALSHRLLDAARARLRRAIHGRSNRLLWRRMALVTATGAAGWGLAGLGFWWLEPTVHDWAHGAWLAFTTGATVGYGDFVPTTLASRLFAVLTVLLGMALLSLTTAAISALLVGETERKMELDLLTEIRALRREVNEIRAQLMQPPAAVGAPTREAAVGTPAAADDAPGGAAAGGAATGAAATGAAVAGAAVAGNAATGGAAAADDAQAS